MADFETIEVQTDVLICGGGKGLSMNDNYYIQSILDALHGGSKVGVKIVCGMLCPFV